MEQAVRGRIPIKFQLGFQNGQGKQHSSDLENLLSAALASDLLIQICQRLLDQPWSPAPKQTDLPNCL